MGLFGKRKKTTVSPLTSDCYMMKYEVGNLQGIGTRSKQEDSFVLANALDEQKYLLSGLMFAVCDGMGGLKDGKIASETAVQSLRSSFKNMNMNKDIALQLRECVFQASDEVHKVLCGEGGTTAVMGIIIHEQLYYASVGDSFLYLYRDGQIYRLNHEHTVCQSLYLENIRDGITEVDSCRCHPEAVALEQFLGIKSLSQVDSSVRPIKLHKDDVILACSDGLARTITESEITEALQWPSVNDKCNRLERCINLKGNINQDNYTAVLVRCI